MKLPPLTADELVPFLRDGLWIAKLATYKADGTIRMTPLGYAVEDGAIRFSTWAKSDAARNLRHDSRASVLIDTPEYPYQGVHYIGHAEVPAETLTPEQYGADFSRYVGGYAAGVEYYRMLTGLGLGDRVAIRFRAGSSVTWDFSKV